MNPGFTSNKPTHYLLDYGDCYTIPSIKLKLLNKSNMHSDQIAEYKNYINTLTVTAIFRKLDKKKVDFLYE